MTKTKRLRTLLTFLCILLIAASAMMTTGCDKSNGEPVQKAWEAIKLGEGEILFELFVIDPDNVETRFLISTDKQTVGEALLELELISGDAGDYGLYIKTVNGTTLDWDTDGMYWAFYIDGEYAVSGVDQTSIEPGKVYCLKAER